MKKREAWISGLFLVLTLVVNGLGSAGFFNGLSQKMVSDRYMTLITPKPFTFAIWSVIYLLLFLSVLLFIFKKDDYYEQATREVSFLFILSSVLNMAWILLFSYEQLFLSSVVIFLFLVSLTSICLRLADIHERGRVIVPVAFGLYAGWVFIATVLNISATLVKWNFRGFGLSEEMFGVVTLVVAVVLVAWVLLKIKNAVLPLPIAWGFYGIYQTLNQVPSAGLYPMLSLTALLGVFVLVAFSVLMFYKNRFSLYPEP